MDKYIQHLLKIAKLGIQKGIATKDPLRKTARLGAISIEIARQVRENVIPSKILVNVISKYPALTYDKLMKAAGSDYRLDEGLFMKAKAAYNFIVSYKKDIPSLDAKSVNYINTLRSVEQLYANRNAHKRFIEDYYKLQKANKIAGTSGVRRWRALLACAMGEK